MGANVATAIKRQAPMTCIGEAAVAGDPT